MYFPFIIIENFQFRFSYFPPKTQNLLQSNLKITWISPILAKFQSNPAGVPAGMLLTMFCLLNGIFVYVLLPTNHEKCLIWGKKLLEIHLSKRMTSWNYEGEQAIAMLEMFFLFFFFLVDRQTTFLKSRISTFIGKLRKLKKNIKEIFSHP